MLKSVFAKFGLPEQEEEFFKLPEKFIDFDIFRDMPDDSYSWAKKLLTIMSIEIEDGVKEIKAAHAEDDWGAVQELAHKFKGGAAYCGTIRLERACFYLEVYIKAQQTNLREALCQQLLKEMVNTAQAIHNWMKL